MTDAWQDPEIKRLHLSLRMGATDAEWLEVECGGRKCRLRVARAHGGYAKLEIDAPLAFAFVREGAKAKVKKGVES